MKRISVLPFSLFTALSLSSCIIVPPGEVAGLLPSTAPRATSTPAATSTPVATAQPSSTPLPEPTALGTPIPKPSPSNASGDFTDNTRFLGQWEIIDAPEAGASNWVADSGVLSQYSNTYRVGEEYTYFEGTHAILKDRTFQNFRLSTKIKPTDDDGFGVVFGYQDEKNLYRVISVKDTGNKGPFTRLQVKRNGTYTTLAEDVIPLHDEVTVPLELQLSVSNGQITVSVNGSQRFNVSEPGFPGGRVGLMTYACSMEVSKFEVQDLN